MGRCSEVDLVRLLGFVSGCGSLIESWDVYRICEGIARGSGTLSELEGLVLAHCLSYGIYERFG